MFDVEDYEILMSGFVDFATEKERYLPSTMSRYKVILDDYFNNNVIGKVKNNNFNEIFSKERLSLLIRKSNNVRPSLLGFLDFLYQEKFIEDFDYYKLQNNIKAVFLSDEQKKDKQNIDFLTPNEVRILFSNQLNFKYDYERNILPLICSLSFFYMFKQEDVIKLTLSDIDLDKNRIRNIRRADENSELVEWLSLNDITLKNLETYLSYRQTFSYLGDSLLIMENVPVDNSKINKLFNCFDRKDNALLFGNKRIYQSLLIRSMILYVLISTNGEGLYQILLEQEMNSSVRDAFEEYLLILRAENKKEFYDRYSLDLILPKKRNVIDEGTYSELNDITQSDIGDYDMNNDRNLESNKITIQRMVRDSKISKSMRMQYNNECQLCGYRLRNSDGEYYSEAHHIQPYNRVHRGDDNSHNIIVLCPNCHTQFDDLYYAIHPETLVVHCIFGKEDQFHLEPLIMNEGHILNRKYLEYTWNLFKEKQISLNLKSK